ncbi:ABC transporter substrate-binding protein [Alicyclobacillus dauci]|uniref:ABC transporter substrate-binding protein n=1 Tax=Alicyclobacillus dauci TaxID=1475485 RepID=A0ABY6Z8U7_9BACL|nr:ABC transporter substrate-binding protein [Alicyclobacillus dauci]WAH39338.1 ABC transporter substrate-binding protein [Alicyclobacillus dauci]
MSKLFNLAATATAILLMASVAGCGTTTPASNKTGGNTGNSKSTTSQSPIEGGSLNIDMGQNIQTLDPAVTDDLTSDELITEMYDPLVTYDGSTNTLVGDMAEKWTVSPDGKTYTFTLRKGITFWNGDPVTANSYIAEFERVLTKKLASPASARLYPIVEGSTAFYKGQAKTISGVTAPDPYTLQIKLVKPESFFLQLLAEPAFVAVDPKWISSVGNANFATSKPMGTGAFELKSTDGTTEVLTKNQHYFLKDSHGNQLPYLDQVTFSYNKNTEVDAMKFQQGSEPFLAFNTQGIPVSSYHMFMANPKLKQDVTTATTGDMWYIGLNVTQAPFTNVKVRQAVEYAINKPFLVKLLNNMDTVANQPVPPDAFGYMKQLPASIDYTYNPEKAKQLLASSGLSLPIHAKFYSSNDATTQKVVEEIQNELKAVGIDLTVQPLSWSAFLSGNGQGTQPSFLIDWNQSFPDAFDFLNTLFNTTEQPINNSEMYSNKQVDQWLNEAQTETDPQKRFDLYKKVTVQAMEDASVVPVYYGKYTFAIQPWVHGYYINSNLEEDPLTHIWVDPGH